MPYPEKYQANEKYYIKFASVAKKKTNKLNAISKLMAKK